MKKRFLKMGHSLAAGPFAEPVMGLTMFMVGFALALPNPTFQFQAYATLSAIAAEEAWAASFLIVGAWQLIAALLEHRTARLLSAMAGGSLWMVWTAGTLHSGFRGVLWAVGISMILGQALAYLRARAMPEVR